MCPEATQLQPASQESGLPEPGHEALGTEQSLRGAVNERAHLVGSIQLRLPAEALHCRAGREAAWRRHGSGAQAWPCSRPSANCAMARSTLLTMGPFHPLPSAAQSTASAAPARWPPQHLPSAPGSSWPRMAPAGYSTVWKFTYTPSVSARASSSGMPAPASGPISASGPKVDLRSWPGVGGRGWGPSFNAHMCRACDVSRSGWQALGV